MEITDELLAAYAEGNVSDAERSAIRDYLMKNPDELESVMMMMDEDFELEPIDEPMEDESKTAGITGLLTDMCCSAAAFAPQTLLNVGGHPKKPKPLKKSVFKNRLNDLLDDLKL